MNFEQKASENLDKIGNDSMYIREVLPIHNGEYPLIIPDEKHPHQLNLEELIKSAEYLIKAISEKGDDRLLLYDHLAYWGWTASCLGNRLVWEPKDFGRKSFERAALQHNISLMTQLFLVSRRSDKMNKENLASLFTDNPSLYTLIEKGDKKRLTTHMSFSVLEGLVALHCSELGSDGRASDDFTIRNRDGEKKSYAEGNGVNLHKQILCWHQNNASKETSSVLDNVNFSSNQKINSFVETVRGLDHRTDPDGTDFLGIITDQRNYNQHGEGSTSIISAIVLTLICLLIWDAMDEEQYKRSRQEVVRKIYNHQEKLPELDSYQEIKKEYSENREVLHYPVYPKSQSIRLDDSG
jgi:hypothetical protein